MNDSPTKKFVDNEITYVSTELTQLQHEIQLLELEFSLNICEYLYMIFLFHLMLSITLNDTTSDEHLLHLGFLETKLYYENAIYSKECIMYNKSYLDTLKKLERLSRQDYAELSMIKADNYNEIQFAKFIERNLERFNEYFDACIL